MDEIDQDYRWACRSTALAACLCTMGFAVKKVQPFLTEIDGASGKQEKIVWLEPELNIPDSVEPIPASRFQWAWDGRKKWEEENPLHPFNYMRKGLEERRRLIEIIKRPPAKVSTSIPSEIFQTSDLKVASVISALEYYLFEFRDRHFTFSAVAEQVARNCEVPLDDTEKTYYNPTKPNGDYLREPWIMAALLNYEAINKRMREPDNTPCVRKERTVNGKKRVMLLPINIPDHIRKSFEHYFYA